MLFLFLTTFVPLVVAKNELYMGYQVYNVKFTSQEQQDSLHRLKADEIDYWIKPNFKYGVAGLAMVPPSHFDWFEKGLLDLGVEKEIAIEDVYKYLLEKETESKKRVAARNGDAIVNDIGEDEEKNFGFDDYYQYNTILNHIYKLRDAYENSTTTSIEVIEFGTTELNKPLIYLKISRPGVAETKPIIVIEGGINPREWITIPSALKVVDEVLDTNQSRYLDSFDWIIIPVANPDGYEYTRTDLRLWEKNLSTKSNFGFICPGVNINRNFNIDWSNADSSSSACSHLYAGTDAVSEIETQLLETIIETYQDRISLYVSLQNGGGYISYPWQYEFAASGMFRQNHLLGMEMVAAMNDDYDLDVSSVAYGDRASGTSSDYARINNALYVFNINIVRRGTDGVIVPENEIVGIVEDVWRAVAVAADHLAQ